MIPKEKRLNGETNRNRSKLSSAELTGVSLKNLLHICNQRISKGILFYHAFQMEGGRRRGELEIFSF